MPGAREEIVLLLEQYGLGPLGAQMWPQTKQGASEGDPSVVPGKDKA